MRVLFCQIYTLSKNTVQDLRKMFQENLEDSKINQTEYEKPSDMYIQRNETKTKK